MPTAKEALSEQDLMRYARHLVLPGVGLEGQVKLMRSSVLIIGAGAIGIELANAFGTCQRL